MRKRVTIRNVCRRTTKAELRELRDFFQGHNQPLLWKARKLAVVEAKVDFEFYHNTIAKVAGIDLREAKGYRVCLNRAIRKIAKVGINDGEFKMGNKRHKLPCLCGEITEFTENELNKKEHPQCSYCGRLLETPIKLEIFDIIDEFRATKKEYVYDDNVDGEIDEEDDEYIRKKFQ